MWCCWCICMKIIFCETIINLQVLRQLLQTWRRGIDQFIHVYQWGDTDSGASMTSRCELWQVHQICSLYTLSASTCHKSVIFTYLAVIYFKYLATNHQAHALTVMIINHHNLAYTSNVTKTCFCNDTLVRQQRWLIMALFPSWESKCNEVNRNFIYFANSELCLNTR